MPTATDIGAFDFAKNDIFGEVEARSVCVCSHLVAKCSYDLGDIALPVFERYANCFVDPPKGVFLGRGPLAWADAKKIVHVGQLGDR